MAFDQSVPDPLRSMCATPNIVLVNIMACRVYRRTKAGVFRQLGVSSVAMSRNTAPVIAISTNRVRTTDEPSYLVDIELASRKVASPTTNGSLATSEYRRGDTLEKQDYSRSYDADK